MALLTFVSTWEGKDQCVSVVLFLKGERVHEASSCAQWRECEGRPEARCIRVLHIDHLQLAAELFIDSDVQIAS